MKGRHKTFLLDLVMSEHNTPCIDIRIDIPRTKLDYNLRPLFVTHDVVETGTKCNYALHTDAKYTQLSQTHIRTNKVVSSSLPLTST